MFDSLVAKLIVTGASRRQALERARRALAEFEVEGMPTVLPFHASVVADPAFAPPADEPFRVHTRWIETEYDNKLTPYAGPVGEAADADPRERVVVEVGGRRLEVVLPAGLGAGAAGPPAAAGPRPARRTAAKKAAVAAGGDSLTSPMQGTIVKVAVADGDEVAEGDLIVVLEAMKMEQPLNAHKAGVISGLAAEVGATVSSGSVLCEIKA